MALKELSMKLHRPRIGVGGKTLVALSLIFWIPMSALAGILFYLFQDLIQQEVTNQIRVNLKAASGIYEERVTLLKGLMRQVTDLPDVRQAFVEKDSAKLQTLLLEFGKMNSFVSVLLDVDENQRIIGRRSDRRGDIANIGDSVSRALLTGGVVSSTELVSKEFLSRENPELANLVADIAIVQFVVAPVRQGDVIVGAMVGGVLLTGDPWLGNTVYDRFGIELALFAGNTPEAFFLHATASLPRKTWALGQVFPSKLKEEIALGNPYYGPMSAAGRDVIVAYEPIKDSRNRIIGAIGVSMAAQNVSAVVLRVLGNGVGVTALIGLGLAGLFVFFVYNDITRPMKYLIEAMDRFGRGDTDVTLNLKTGDQFETLGDGFNAMADGIRKREERFRKHNQVAKLFMSTMDLDELLDQTLKIVVGVTESQLGIVYLWEEAQQMLIPHAQYGARTDLPSFNMGEGFPGRAAKDLSTLILTSPHGGETETVEMGFTQSMPKAVAYIPLAYQESILGVLVLGSVYKYKEDVVQLFDFLADQISIALDNAIMHQKVQESSIKDGLTGLYNRRYMNARLEEEWSRSVRRGQPVTVLLSDIDDFKAINDTYGHAKGDEVLRRVAEIFKANARREDLVARYGGEEFIAVLFDTDTEGAQHLAQRICDQARAQDYPGLDRKVTLSIGIVTFPGVHACSHEEMVRSADQAMYKAKVTGKDKVVASEPEFA